VTRVVQRNVVQGYWHARMLACIQVLAPMKGAVGCFVRLTVAAGSDTICNRN
jgi:hypothetical protein